MRMFESSESGRQGAALVALGLLAAGLLGAWWVSQRVVAQDYQTLLLLVGATQGIWILFRWRTSVYVLHVYILIEGFLINYFVQYPGLNLVKDLMVMALFLVLGAATLSRGIIPFPRTYWVLPFTAFALVYTIQIFNPNLPNIFVGLIGMRVMLLFALLAPIGYWFFDTRERVTKYFLFMVAASVPISLFGIFQYFAGPGWLVSLSPGFSRAIFYAPVGEGRMFTAYFRTISTFVQTGGFSTYLWFIMTVTVAMLAMPSLRKYRIWVLGAFASQLIGLLTTGGRTPFVLFFVTLALLMIMRGRLVRLAFVLSLALLVFALGMVLLGPEVAGRFATVLDLDVVAARNLPLVYGWLYQAMQTDPAGLGAGYATVASRHAGITPLNQGVVENTIARIRFETGILGMILFILFVLAATWDCIQIPLRVLDPDMSWLAYACASFIVVNLCLSLPQGTPFDVSPTNVYLWFFLGFLARVRVLDSELRRAPAAPAAEMTAAQA